MAFVPDPPEEQQSAGRFVPDTPSGPLKMTVGQQLMNHPITQGAVALGETGLALAHGASTAITGGLGGAGTVGYNLLKGKGWDDSMQAGADVVNATTAKTFQPKTPLGKSLHSAAMYLPEKSIEGWRQIGGAAGEALGNRELGETLGGVGMESLMAVAPGPKMLKQSRAASEAAAQPTVASTYPERQTQAQITTEQSKYGQQQAAEAAARHGIAVDLPDLDKGIRAKIDRTIADPEHVHAVFAEVNKGKPEMALKTAVGVDPEAPLTRQTLDTNLDRLAGPKRQIEAMDGFIDSDGTAVNQLRQLMPERTVGMGDEFKAAAIEINKHIVDLNTNQGVGSGTAIMKSIESLRKAARDIFDNDITPERRNTANIYKGAADALEGIVERRLAAEAPSLLAEYQKNRTGMAQTYLLKDILDNNTNKVRLDKLARMTEGDDGITGAFSDFGKIYANSPEIFKPLTKEAMPIRFSRWTIPGALGAGIGSAVAPGVGTVMAAGAGTLLGRRMSTKAARRLASPERQAQYTDALRKQSLTREQLGYEPVPEPLAIEQQSPHPPSPMGGTTVGTGPRDTGVINLAPQLATGLPSPGMGPQAALRAGSRDTTPQSPQMPAVEMPLTPKPGATPLYERGGLPPEEGLRMQQQAELLRMPEVPYPGPPEMRPNVLTTEIGAGGGAGARAFGGEGPPNPPARGGGIQGWKPDPAALDYPLQAELHKRYLGPIKEAMARGDDAMMAQLEAAFDRDLAALNSQSSFEALYNPQSGRAQAANAALHRSNQFDPSISQSQIPPFQGAP